MRRIREDADAEFERRAALHDKEIVRAQAGAPRTPVTSRMDAHMARMIARRRSAH